MRLCLIAAFMVLFISPTLARIPGNGSPVLMSGCSSLAEALVMVERLVAGQQRQPILPTCRSISPFYPTDIDKQRLVAGPLVDWEGDTFAVFEVQLNSGGTIYAFVWWRSGFSPVGMRI